MKFDKLHDIIPYVTGGKAKVLEMHPYNAITLAMPGRHAKDTIPLGGDFVVMVDDDTLDWTKHQFTHTDIFNDVAQKRKNDISLAQMLFLDYRDIIQGADPSILAAKWECWNGSLHPQTFLYAVQCLAVAEHRRYARHETKFGGRYLPFRFSAGIVEGLWTASDAIEKQRMGRPGVEWLEKEKGVPESTKTIMMTRV